MVQIVIRGPLETIFVFFPHYFALFIYIKYLNKELMILSLAFLIKLTVISLRLKNLFFPFLISNGKSGKLQYHAKKDTTYYEQLYKASETSDIISELIMV